MSRLTPAPGSHGIPVLAFLGPEPREPLSLSCLLRIQHHEPREQVTLMLRACVSLDGADDEQAFVAQYDADNFAPDTTTNDTTIDIPDTRHAEIVRNRKSSRLTTLSLRLKHTPPLWCPHRDALVPKLGASHVTSFNELVQLAKATTVHIVFDYHWLNLDARVPMQRIATGKETLTGFPVASYYARFFRRADWTVFGPSSESKKRSRQVSSPPSSPQSSPLPPPYKRIVADQEQAPSPTERATSPAADKTKDHDEDDFQTLAITNVVLRHLPAAVVQVLPAVLKEVLPTLLPALFALPVSFASSFDSIDSSQSTSAQHPHVPPAHPLTPLGESLLPHMIAHISPQLSKLHNASIKKWSDSAALEFEEMADDYKAELTQIAEDGVAQLTCEVGYKLDEVRDDGRHVAELVSQELEDVVRASAEREIARVRREIVAAAAIWPSTSAKARPRGCRRVGQGGYRGLGSR
ncbi:hypothetical protein N0V95_000600 [Ascochyta clinopodiicola]|nr:hypothetical protein N0V95_000600 [Ascochyta clinopodiicola]